MRPSFVTSALCLSLAACAEGGPLGASIDDDGCPGSYGCKKSVEEPPASAVSPAPETDSHCVNCCSDDGFDCPPGGTPGGGSTGGVGGVWPYETCYNKCGFGQCHMPGCTKNCPDMC